MEFHTEDEPINVSLTPAGEAAASTDGFSAVLQAPSKCGKGGLLTVVTDGTRIGWSWGSPGDPIDMSRGLKVARGRLSCKRTNVCFIGGGSSLRDASWPYHAAVSVMSMGRAPRWLDWHGMASSNNQSSTKMENK